MQKIVLVTIGVCLGALASQTGAAPRKSPFGPAERDRLLAMCELGRQVETKGDSDGARKILHMMMEASPFPDAAIDQCTEYTMDYLRNPKNPTYVRIARQAAQATAAAKRGKTNPPK